MTDAERVQKVRAKMDWGRPSACTVCGESMVKARGFMHLQKPIYRNTANHYVCNKCLAVAAEIGRHADDFAGEPEEVKP